MKTNVAHYQEIQDMRSPRTARSEFRSHAKSAPAYRPMTPINDAQPDPAPVPLWLMLLGVALWSGLLLIGILLCLDQWGLIS